MKTKILTLLLVFALLGFSGAITSHPHRLTAQQVTPTPPPLYLPLVLRAHPAAGASQEWTQHAHDAQHTGYTAQVVPHPWRLRWIWNGVDASGRVSKVTTGGSLPRNVQPVTGGGRVYIAAGVDGVFALSETTGQQLWQQSGIGAVRSTCLLYTSPSPRDS